MTSLILTDIHLLANWLSLAVSGRSSHEGAGLMDWESAGNHQCNEQNPQQGLIMHALAASPSLAVQAYASCTG